MDRRYFLMTSAATAASVRPHMLASPNNTVRVACVGVRGQGGAHISNYSKMQNVEIAAICDVDESVRNRRLGEIEKSGKKRPAGFSDVRKLLEDKSIDAISIATPNHQHTLQTIWGCQAGKDVYVEKPCSYNMFEARQIAAAAEKYNRIVQHGTNARSSAGTREGVRQLRQGVIGDVYMGRGLCFKWRDTIGHASDQPAPPPGVDYDLWLGPAPKRPFNKNRFHYTWHWFWDYGNGDIGNQGIHQMDAVRWGLGVTYPTRVSAMGGHYMFDDDQQTPNTLVATYEFNEGGKKKLLVFEVRHWISNQEGGIGKPGGNTIGCLLYGSKGYMTLGGGYRTWLGKEQQPGPSGSGGGNNWVNFIDVVRSRDKAAQNAPISEGAISTTLVHLANISYRLGRAIRFDAKTYTCPGDAEATRMFTRPYRAPFVVPRIA
ncbi:MAG: Gfo/Idh/MocA family oxidoreductase [Acidobacteria bacterium]|nr:Gfo/Idh/MocA family oxidoreductase [Acidobacteriota bacterium]